MLSDPKSAFRVRLRREFPGLNIVRSRHDRTKVFIYHTKSKRPLTADPIKERALFKAQYDAAEAGEPAPGEAAKKAKGTVAQGTWNAAIDLWLATPKWKTVLSENTRRLYRPMIEALRSGQGTKLMRYTTPWDVRELHDDVLAIKGKAQANTFFSVLKHVVAVGRYKQWVPANVDLLAAIELQEVENTSYRSYLDEEIASWRAQHVEGTMARKAFELAYRLGMATSDLIRLSPARIDARGYVLQGRKKNDGKQRSNINNDAELRAVLESFDRTGKAADVPYLHNQWGAPFQPSAFRKQWVRWCQEAGLPSDFKIHGARATMVVDMIDHGVDSRDGMKLTGHRDQKVFERIYGKGASEEIATDRAQRALVAARDRKEGKRPVLRAVA